MDAEATMDEADYQDPQSPFWDWGRAIGWFPDDGRRPGGAKQFLRTQRLPRRTNTDEVCSTSSTTQMPVWIIEEVTDTSIPALFEREIWCGSA